MAYAIIESFAPSACGRGEGLRGGCAGLHSRHLVSLDSKKKEAARMGGFLW